MWDWQPHACCLTGSLPLPFLEILFKQGKQCEIDWGNFQLKESISVFVAFTAVSAPHAILSDWSARKRTKMKGWWADDRGGTVFTEDVGVIVWLPDSETWVQAFINCHLLLFCWVLGCCQSSISLGTMTNAFFRCKLTTTTTSVQKVLQSFLLTSKHGQILHWIL